MTADEIKKLLNLAPHPCEGGFYRRTWSSEVMVPHAVLPARYPADRRAGTCIYYLLEPRTFSEMHRLASDEIFHFYYGDPVEMLQLLPDGSAQTVILGNDLARGQYPQIIVPSRVWQGSRLLPGGQVALFGCTVCPGFDFADYESGRRDSLQRDYPTSSDLIGILTHA
jgi:uncharacterized protein